MTTPYAVTSNSPSLAPARKSVHSTALNQLTREMLGWADAVLAMDASVLDVLREIADDDVQPSLRLYLGDSDVPDPTGKDQDAFNACAVLIEAATALHVGRPRQ